jgi:hypothetical protein
MARRYALEQMVVRSSLWKEQGDMVTQSQQARPVHQENRWLKLAGVAGVAFLVLFIIQFVAGPQGPAFNAAPQEIISYYAQHQAGVELMAWLVALFAILYGVFLAGIWAELRQTSASWLATLGLIFGISNGALLFVGHAIDVGLASFLSTANTNTDPAVIVPLFKVSNLLTMNLNVCMDGVAVLALSLALLADGMLARRARWLGWAGVFAGTMYLIGSLAVFDPTGPIQIAPLLGVVGWFIWLGGLSLHLLRSGAPHSLARARGEVVPTA